MRSLWSFAIATSDPDEGSQKERRMIVDTELTQVDVVQQTPVLAPAFDVTDLSVDYGNAPAIAGVSVRVPANRITAVIGPSGCGKSTLIRCFNRMNDLILNAKITGAIKYHGVDLYASNVDAVEVRRRI